MNPIRTTTLLPLALAALLAACGSTTAADGDSAPDAADADVTVTAVDMAFDPGTVTLAASKATIALVNEDTMPHNIAIYTDESKSEKLFEGEMVTDGTVVYEIAGLEPGEYFFDCSLHPDMKGTLAVEG